MEIFKINGIILKKKEYGENNLLVTIFSKEIGKILAMSFGVTKSKKRSLAAYNPMNIVEFTISKRNNFYSIKEANITKVFKNILSDIEKLEISLYILDCIDKIYDESVENERFFLKLTDILSYINETDELKQGYKYYIIVAFLHRIMAEHGIYEIGEIKSLLKKELFLEYKKILTLNKDLNFQEKVEKHKKSLKKIIIIFEKYINMQLQVELNVQKFILEGIYGK
ncbi:DNA repair protein RecO [Leptotrichia sp. oral taxon 218]|jgi:DNA repair protein recO|uniref:DNA repair protein RecO n=1 Tax=Leptotrichia sp. oral taxon 218 TaxID=712361 RepID=UPI001B8B088B|nr:DNA repair protein RecO [Leptotrichia sp. oral taxon 218]QUB94538.1 DNA repair protein RecO [Leptotrichia sp. oral taxon 218]